MIFKLENVLHFSFKKAKHFKFNYVFLSIFTKKQNFKIFFDSFETLHIRNIIFKNYTKTN